MTNEVAAQAITAGVVAILYYIFSSLFKKVKEVTSKSKHIKVPDTFLEELNINDKESFLKRIDYWIDNGDFEEALHLCNIYNESYENDSEITKRIKYGENLKNLTNEDSLSSENINKNDKVREGILLILKKRELLKETFDSGLITQNELNEKLKFLKKEKQLLESKLKETLKEEKENKFQLKIQEEIKFNKEKLLELKKQGLLTENEYNDKVDFLYKKQIEINEKERLGENKELEVKNGSKLSEKTEYLLVGGAILIVLLFTAFKYYTSSF